jgi:S-formylglutathione hydrolase FrmB
MKPLVRRLFAVLLAGFLVSRAAGADERISFHKIASAALGQELPVTVIAPEKPAAADNAVLFLLHGRGRNHRSLTDSATTRAALLTTSFYIVLPQGEDGWYLDSPAIPAAKYESWLGEIIAWADAKLPVSKDRARTGIAGWSMGGYGAVRFAETHPARMGYAGSMIGLLDFPRAETLPQGQNYKVPVARFGADPAVWAKLNPLNQAAALRETSLTLVIAGEAFDRTMNENFIAALTAQKITAQVHRLEGGHTFAVVEKALPLVLADAAKFFSLAAKTP